MPFWLAGMSPNNVHIIYIFTFALESSLLGQIIITETILSQQRTLPVKIPADLRGFFSNYPESRDDNSLA